MLALALAFWLGPGAWCRRRSALAWAPGGRRQATLRTCMQLRQLGLWQQLALQQQPVQPLPLQLLVVVALVGMP